VFSMPSGGDTMMAETRRDTMDALASLDAGTPAKRTFGTALTNKTNLHELNQPPKAKKATFFSDQKEAKSVYQNKYGQTPSKKKMEGGTARARAALEQPKAARTSKLNPSFASTVAVKDVAKDYEETYVLGNDGEMELTNGKEKVLFNLAEQAPATPVQRKMSQHSNLLIQTLTPSNSRPSTAAMLASVSPTSELEYDDSIMFSTRDDDDDDDDEAAADETAIAFPISASKGEASKRTTPPVQMVSFETPGRVSYSADYYAKQNASPSASEMGSPAAELLAASVAKEACQPFKGIVLESFDAKSTATDDVEELAAEPVAAAPALAATEVTLAATESTVAEVAEVQAAAAPAVVEQSVDMARLRFLKQKKMEKELLFGKLVAEFGQFLLRADQLTATQENEMVKMMDSLGTVQRSIHELDVQAQEMYGLTQESASSVVSEASGHLAKQLLLGLCKVAPKSRRDSKMNTSVNPNDSQLVTMDRRALAGVESALNERVEEMNKQAVIQNRKLAEAKVAMRNMSMNASRMNVTNNTSASQMNPNRMSTAMNQSNMLDASGLSMLENHYSQQTDSLREEVKSLRHSMYEMHMAKQEEIDTLQREKEYYQQHKGKKVSMRRKISHGLFGKKRRSQAQSQYGENMMSTPVPKRAGKRRTRYSTLFGTPKNKNK